jgi:hypothetical protein
MEEKDLLRNSINLDEKNTGCSNKHETRTEVTYANKAGIKFGDPMHILESRKHLNDDAFWIQCPAGQPAVRWERRHQARRAARRSAVALREWPQLPIAGTTY